MTVRDGSRTDRRNGHGSAQVPYQVFSAEGAWLGQVMLLPHRRRCFQIGEDYILGTWKDELDVQCVRMYTLDRGME